MALKMAHLAHKRAKKIFDLTLAHAKISHKWHLPLTNQSQNFFVRSHSPSCENSPQNGEFSSQMGKKFFFRSHTRSRENCPYTVVSTHAQISRTLTPPPLSPSSTRWAMELSGPVE